MADETNLLGFNLYRATGSSGPGVRLTRLVILKRGSASRYTRIDRTAKRGVAYWYRLAAVDQAGVETPLVTVRALASR